MYVLWDHMLGIAWLFDCIVVLYAVARLTFLLDGVSIVLVCTFVIYFKSQVEQGLQFIAKSAVKNITSIVIMLYVP